MNILKKSALGLCASLLFTMLFAFGLAFGLHQVFGTPDAIKSALKDSGFYQSVVGDALEQAQSKGQASGGEDEIPVGRPEVQNIIKNAASPEILQTQTEGVLDSVYDWLQGKTPKLQFAVELGETKTKLADGLAQYVEQHLASLPACAPGTIPGGDIDPFNATCLPQGVSPAQSAAEARNQILSGEFLKDTTLTADSVKTDGGKTLEEQLQAIPAAYKGVKWAVYAAGLLALLMAVAVVLLSVNWRSGLKKVSLALIIVGAVSAALSWLASYGVGRAEELAKEPLQQSGIRIAEALANDLRGWWMWYGVTLVLLSAATLITLHFTKPKTAPPEATKPDETTGGNRPAPDMAAKPQDRPKLPKKLVQ